MNSENIPGPAPGGYEPNFKDKRVIRRVKHALEFCDLNFSPKKQTEVMSAQIRRHLGGALSKDSLPEYLHRKLLVRTANYSTGLRNETGQLIFAPRPNAYVLNQDAFKHLHAAIGKPALSYYVDLILENQERKDQVKIELEQRKFEYKDKSFRLWHPLQNMKRKIKQGFWAQHGFEWNYDIQACAPTLLYQMARRYDLYDGEHMVVIRDYLDNRTHYRNYLAEVAGIEPDDAKGIITSLFNGGILWGTSCAAYDTVGQDLEVLHKVKQDPFMVKLRFAINRMWVNLKLAAQLRSMAKDMDYANPEFAVRNFTRDGSKWELYFSLERRVMDVVEIAANKQGANIFREHDGFISDMKVDIKKLQEAVAEDGFDIEFDSGWKI
jgi:hypothetical protein